MEIYTFPQNPQPHFWMTYGIYNIGTKILSIKRDLYSNSQPHRPKPNTLWTKTLSLYTKISIPSETIDNLTFKSLYQTLLKPDPNPTPITNTMVTAYTYKTPPFPLFKPEKGNILQDNL